MTSFFVAPGRPSARRREFTAEALRRRLAELPLFDIDDCSRSVIEELTAFNRSALASREQLRTLDVLRSYTEPLLSRLEITLVGATPPIAPDVRKAAQLVDRLLRELAHAHARVVLNAMNSWSLFGYRMVLYVPLVRALDLLARRLTLAHRLYAKAPRGTWAKMHELYGLAHDWKLANREIVSPRISALAVYRKALLLDFAEPQRLAPGDLRRVNDYITKFGNAARIVPIQPFAQPTGVFVVDVLNDRAGLPIAKHAGVDRLSRGFLLATVPLLRRLGRHVRALEKGASPLEIGLPSDAAVGYYRSLLQRLLDNWTGLRRPRSPRMHFRPRAEIQIGFENAWRFLSRIGDPPSAFARIEMDRQRPATEWAVLNESPGGYALRHVRGALPAVRVGELVAVRAPDREGVSISVVRWIQSEHADHMDIGLQQLAPRLRPVMIASPGSISSGYVRALFAPPSSRFNRVPVLVAPSRQARTNRKIVVRSLDAEFQVHAQRVLESTHQFDLLQVSIS
jgi:hypothetical protein